jgi:hypothetical protein
MRTSHQPGEVFGGLLPVGLASLGGVNPAQADSVLGLLGIEDDDGVAVHDPDHLAR